MVCFRHARLRLTRLRPFIESAHLMIVCFDDHSRETWNRRLEHQRRTSKRNIQGASKRPRDLRDIISGLYHAIHSRGVPHVIVYERPGSAHCTDDLHVRRLMESIGHQYYEPSEAGGEGEVRLHIYISISISISISICITICTSTCTYTRIHTSIHPCTRIHPLA
jgi:hypothetical protein